MNGNETIGQLREERESLYELSDAARGDYESLQAIGQAIEHVDVQIAELEHEQH